MNKKRFVNFTEYLESFTARVVSNYPQTKDFIEAEKKNVLDRFPELAPQQSQITEMSTYEKVRDTLRFSVKLTRLQCYHQLDIKRNDPEECIESINLLSSAIGNAHKDILYYSSLQGELLQALKDSSTPEGYRLMLLYNLNLSKTHANFLIKFNKLSMKYPRIIYCELPQNFFVKNIYTVEHVCDDEPLFWSNI